MRLPRIVTRQITQDEFFARFAGREFTMGDIETLLKPDDPFSTLMAMISAGTVRTTKRSPCNTASFLMETPGHAIARKKREAKAAAFITAQKARKEAALAARAGTYAETATRPLSGQERGL